MGNFYFIQNVPNEWQIFALQGCSIYISVLGMAEVDGNSWWDYKRRLRRSFHFEGKLFLPINLDTKPALGNISVKAYNTRSSINGLTDVITTSEIFCCASVSSSSKQPVAGF
jgi:hypothetical protein